MGGPIANALYVLAMVIVIIGLDLAFFKNRFWPRLILNVGIVLAFAMVFLIFLHRP